MRPSSMRCRSAVDRLFGDVMIVLFDYRMSGSQGREGGMYDALYLTDHCYIPGIDCVFICVYG